MYLKYFRPGALTQYISTLAFQLQATTHSVLSTSKRPKHYFLIPSPLDSCFDCLPHRPLNPRILPSHLVPISSLGTTPLYSHQQLHMAFRVTLILGVPVNGT
jgi:hypothetical protein